MEINVIFHGKMFVGCLFRMEKEYTLVIILCNILHTVCQNTNFLWPVFSHIRTGSKVLSVYWGIRVRENPYSGTLHTVIPCL